nr:MAG TPA: hypothetical protein [Caudoviricetes sp.]
MQFANFDYTIVATCKLVNTFLFILQTFSLTLFQYAIIIRINRR